MPYSRGPSETHSEVLQLPRTWSGVAFPKPASLPLWLCWSEVILARRQQRSIVPYRRAKAKLMGVDRAQP